MGTNVIVGNDRVKILAAVRHKIAPLFWKNVDKAAKDLLPDKEFVERVLQQRFSLFRLQIRDHWIHTLRYVLRMIFCPSKKEWLLFSVPGPLTFVYYLFRPFQVAWSTGQGVVKGKWRRI